MPVLFAVGQHSALDAVQEELQEGEVLCWRSMIIHVVTPDPTRVFPIYAVLQEHLYACARIKINGGKTQVWNRGGTIPAACDVLEHNAQSLDPDAQVWRGPHLPESEQGMKVLGSPLGHPSFIQQFLRKKALPDVQSAWSLLLHCASKSTASGGLLSPMQLLSLPICTINGSGIVCVNCFTSTLNRNEVIHSASSVRIGWIGPRNAARTSVSAYWASWADTLPMIRARHGAVADLFVRELEGELESPFLAAAPEAMVSHRDHGLHASFILEGPRSRARVVVLAVEVGGRWSAETSSFLAQLANAKARPETPLLQKRAEQAWRLRWAGSFACAAAKAVASSLHELRLRMGLTGTPLHVLRCWPTIDTMGWHPDSHF